MTFIGTVYKSGKFWISEVQALDAMTQGKSRKDAIRMLKVLLAEMVEAPDFRVEVREEGPKFLLVDTNNSAAIMAVMLKRQRVKQGLTLRDVSERLGSTSPNAYAAYESGKREPSITKLEELMGVIDPKRQLRLKVG